MAKVSQSSVKYVIEARLESSGLVDKPDIVGAIFGQTEGLLGEDLDLRELQERGRVGRIQVKVEKSNGSSSASIEIPSSLDATNTALLAAALETIERVGPTTAEIEVERISDERTSKRDYIVKRAKQLLDDLNNQSPDHRKITDEVKKEVRKKNIKDFHGFKAGPGVEESDEIILVEGRADLMNLLRYGVKNALAIGGTDVPDKLLEITGGREVTAFLDGDRGGDLILEELREKAELDHVARAPENKEVEELEKKEVFRGLRDKKPEKFVDESSVEKQPPEDERKQLSEALKDLVGTRAVRTYSEDYEIKEKAPANNVEILEEGCHAFAIDGKIDQEKIEKAEELKAEIIAGMEKSGRATSSQLDLVTKEEL